MELCKSLCCAKCSFSKPSNLCSTTRVIYLLTSNNSTRKICWVPYTIVLCNKSTTSFVDFSHRGRAVTSWNQFVRRKSLRACSPYQSWSKNSKQHCRQAQRTSHTTRRLCRASCLAKALFDQIARSGLSDHQL